MRWPKKVTWWWRWCLTVVGSSCPTYYIVVKASTQLQNWRASEKKSLEFSWCDLVLGVLLFYRKIWWGMTDHHNLVFCDTHLGLGIMQAPGRFDGRLGVLTGHSGKNVPQKDSKKVDGRFMALGLSVLVGTVSWFDSLCRTCASVKKRWIYRWNQNTMCVKQSYGSGDPFPFPPKHVMQINAEVHVFLFVHPQVCMSVMCFSIYVHRRAHS